MLPRNLVNLLRVSLEATEKAGAAIVNCRSSNNLRVIEKENNEGPQTKADVLSQKILIQSINDNFPELLQSTIAEEGKIYKKLDGQDTIYGKSFMFHTF